MECVGGKKPIIRIFHVYKRFGSKNALVDVTIDVMSKDFFYITGPSGAGKSTLLKLLYLGEPLSEGQILVDGMNLSRIPRKNIPSLRRKYGIIFQDYKLIPTRSVYENIALVLESIGKNKKYIEKKVKTVLRTVGMERKSNAFPPSLSGGEQQRVAVARAVVGNPMIILADEPTGSLDDKSAYTIVEFLKQINRQGTTVIVATHDKEMIRYTGGRVIRLNQGRVEACDSL